MNMFDQTFIQEKIDLISRDLKRLEEFRDFTIDEMAKDYVRFAALKNFMVEIIGRAIDINQHLILENAVVTESAPLTYSETFSYLGKSGVLPTDFAKEISKSAGFRNAIVHDYNNLDKGIVYRSVGEAIDQYAEYCKHILKFLKEKNT